MRDPADDFTPIELMFLARATVCKSAYNGLTADDEFVSAMEDSTMIKTIETAMRQVTTKPQVQAAFFNTQHL